MEELFTNAITRVPAMENAEVKAFFNGPEAFTPDADFLLGETDVPGFWIAAGGCAHGLAGAGGVGKVMSEWIVDGRPEWDVWPLDWRRFGRQYRSREYTLARTYEALSQYYDIKYPGEERKAGRPAPCIAGISAAYLAGRVLRGEGRLGARQLVRVECGGRRRVAAAARLGGRELVAGDRGRGAGGARGGRALRPVVVLEDRGARPGRARVPRAAVREPDRPAGRHGRLHAAPQPARRDRGRPVGDAARRGPVPARDRHGVRDARPRLARAEHAARRIGLRQRRHVGATPASASGGRRRARSSASTTATCRRAR